MRAPKILQKRERSVKADVNALLAKYDLWKYMAPASRFGMPALDYLVCFRGRFLAIETKRPNKKPTPRQWETIKALRAAGAMVFVVRDNRGLDYLAAHISATNDCFDHGATVIHDQYRVWEDSLGFGGAPKAPRPRRNRRADVPATPAPPVSGERSAELQGSTA